MENEKCWICRRTKKDIKSMMEKVIEDDVCELIEIEAEESKDFDFFKKNKFHLCGICWRLLNGYIDSRHECLHDFE